MRLGTPVRPTEGGGNSRFNDWGDVTDARRRSSIARPDHRPGGHHRGPTMWQAEISGLLAASGPVRNDRRAGDGEQG